MELTGPGTWEVECGGDLSVSGRGADVTDFNRSEQTSVCRTVLCRQWSTRQQCAHEPNGALSRARDTRQ